MTDSKKTYIAYLIGSICHAKDREHAFDASEKAVVDAGHLALNPVKEEPSKTGMSCSDTEEKLSTYWRTEQFGEYRKLMNAIWTKDLDNVRRADYLVLHFEHTDSSVGAPLEMAMASLPYLIKLAKDSCNEAGKAWAVHADLTAVYVGMGITRGMIRGILHAQNHGRAVEFRTL